MPPTPSTTPAGSRRTGRASPTRRPAATARTSTSSCRRLDGEPETVWEVAGYHTVSGWAPDGSFLVVSRHHSNLNNDLYRLDLESGEAALLTPHEGDARFSGARVVPGGRQRLPGHRQGRGLHAARASRPLDAGAHLPDAGRLGRGGRGALQGRPLPAREPQRRGLLGPRALLGRGEAHAGRAVARGHRRRLRVLARLGRLAFTLVGPTRNPDVWVLDLPDGEPRRVTRSSTAGIPRSSFRRPSLVRYPSFDGREIPALFYEPGEQDGRARDRQRARRAGEPVAARPSPP